MNNIIKDEISRINSEKTISEFEDQVSEDIYKWCMLRDEIFETAEQAIKAYWSEMLNDSNSWKHSAPRIPGMFRRS